MSDTPLYIEFGPGLAFQFDDLADSMMCALRKLFRAHIVSQPTPGQRPMRIDSTPLEPPQDTTWIAKRESVRAGHAGDHIVFAAPGVSAWCKPQQSADLPACKRADKDESGSSGIAGDAPQPPSAGGIKLTDADTRTIEHFAGVALLPMLLELALPHGWYGMHAAAVAIEGRGILMPGDSGRGKSTLFQNVAAQGFDTLSDDLVWLCQTEAGFELYPLRRGGLDDAAPGPSVEKAMLCAIVCPGITDRIENQIRPIAASTLLRTLVDQSGFLGTDAQKKKMFAMLNSLRHAAPSYSLEAGSNQEAVPSLLRELVFR